MDKEELLQLRYKVIADWPDGVFHKGDILFVHYNKPYHSDNIVLPYNVYEGLSSKWLDLTEMEKYPHLFKKLSWWEERKVEDMPEYIKNIADGRIDKFLKVVPNELYPRKITARIYLDGGIYEYIEDKRANPATLEEYIEYQKQKV